MGVMEEGTSCEEYGHVYEECRSELCDPGCKFLTCVDCGDQYEEG